ncbi:DNA polymerase I [Desulfotalea psychrophila]|uniref:DNA polymerase I n=1 Tax=Desulfotalea psychrophila (strain LSv54 / DSM 12343) TaxID=177439 RepID=Q6APA8_DESPS|nr:DNA polymerase I [Desulfotalea psychrophila]CAG35816.1 probable DNA polymerase I [Desulfotalea psychrophila LSv54]
MKNNIYVIDGSAYIYRAYHAVAPLTTREGLHTHAILGFVNMIRRLIKDKVPALMVIAFDSRGPVFRHEMYPKYKANRPMMPEDLQEQIPYIKEFVKASGLLLLEEAGVEADDIIASIAKKFASEECAVTVVSGDKDLLQLVDANVSMFDPMKDKLMDSVAVHEKYNVYPHQLLDTFALMGDSADNIPGVPGVGPKTAEKLINAHGSLEGLYENVSGMKQSKMKEKIIANRDLAFLSRDLISLKMDVEIPSALQDYQLGGEQEAQLNELFTKLEFNRFLKGGEPTKNKKVAGTGFSLVQTSEALAQMAAVLGHASRIVIDTETTSLDARTAGLVGISLCAELDRAWYIPLAHIEATGTPVPGQLPISEVMAVLEPLLTCADILKVGHNLKYDWTVLKMQTGVEIFPLADTMVAAHLLEKGRTLKLDDLCAEIGLELTSFAEVVAEDKRADAFAYVALKEACHYSCEDVYGALSLWQDFGEKLSDKALDGLFYDVEMPIIPVLAKMEIGGVCLDSTVLVELAAQFEEQIGELAATIYQEVGHEFNISSPKQLGVILFEELGLPHGRKTKTGFSTDVKVMEKLASQHPVPALILKYRTIAKLKSTYVDKLLLLKNPETGRIYTSFNQTITATGRLSSSNPNMQNIPIRMEEGNRIRRAFVPEAGKVFLAADYSQIDLRVLAHYSGDDALTRAFAAGQDIHARTAAELFSVSTMLVNPEMRRVAKSINFGIVYGMSAFGLAQQLGIGRKEAQRFIDRYFHLYAGVKQFMIDIVEQTRERGYATTLLGRRRAVPDIDAKNKGMREFAERMAINTPIQGTAADIIKCAMIAVEKKLAAAGLGAKMLLQIHDELVFEVSEAELAETRVVVQEAMESALQLDVPLVANIEVGHSLAK